MPSARSRRPTSSTARSRTSRRSARAASRRRTATLPSTPIRRSSPTPRAASVRLARFAAFFVAGLALAQAFAQALEGKALADALRQGGYVLYLRHASTDFGQSDE